VIAINELSNRLQTELHSRNLSSITLGPGGPAILILCGHTSVAEAKAIKFILYDFSQLSGQVPNLQKSSILFSKNVNDQIKDQIRAIFPVPDLLPNTMNERI
jgi:hypothetical protein